MTIQTLRELKADTECCAIRCGDPIEVKVVVSYRSHGDEHEITAGYCKSHGLDRIKGVSIQVDPTIVLTAAKEVEPTYKINGTRI